MDAKLQNLKRNALLGDYESLQRYVICSYRARQISEETLTLAYYCKDPVATKLLNRKPSKLASYIAWLCDSNINSRADLVFVSVIALFEETNQYNAVREAKSFFHGDANALDRCVTDYRKECKNTHFRCNKNYSLACNYTRYALEALQYSGKSFLQWQFKNTEREKYAGPLNVMDYVTRLTNIRVRKLYKAALAKVVRYLYLEEV